MFTISLKSGRIHIQSRNMVDSAPIIWTTDRVARTVTTFIKSKLTNECTWGEFSEDPGSAMKCGCLRISYRDPMAHSSDRNYLSECFHYVVRASYWMVRDVIVPLCSPRNLPLRCYDAMRLSHLRHVCDKEQYSTWWFYCGRGWTPGTKSFLGLIKWLSTTEFLADDNSERDSWDGRQRTRNLVVPEFWTDVDIRIFSKTRGRRKSKAEW